MALIAAHKWSDRSALNAGAMPFKRGKVAGLMSAAGIAVAQRDARAWMTAVH